MNEIVNTATTVETTLENTTEATTQTSNAAEGVFRVGETSVYKDVAALLKGAQEKEKMLTQLKAENAELREQLSRSANIEDFRKELLKMSEMTGEDISKMSVDATNTISAEEIQKIVLQSMQQEQIRTAKEANLNKAMADLQATYGTEAENKLTVKSQELGMSVEALKDLAKDSPNAFRTLMGVQESRTVSLQDVQRFSATNAATQRGAMDELKENPNLMNNGQYLNDLFKRALKDPSILDGFTWDIKR
jgi:hypothetical protein